MLMLILNLFLIIIGGLIHRYKGGGWEDLPVIGHQGAIVKRLAWGIYSGLIAYIFTDNLIFSLVFILPATLTSIIIGHSSAQGMGHVPMGTNKEKKIHEYPLTYLIKLFPSLGPKLSWIIPPGENFSQKGFYVSCLEFVTIGIIRGGFLALVQILLIFALGLLFCTRIELGSLSLIEALLPLPLFMGLFYPIAYVVGYIIPISLNSLKAQSTEWGEFFIGCGWTIAYMLALIALKA